MADRSTLHVNQLEAFAKWAESEGFTLEPTKGTYEVLRLRHPKRRHPVIVYDRISNDSGGKLVHLTVLNRDWPIVRRFQRSRKADA